MRAHIALCLTVSVMSPGPENSGGGGVVGEGQGLAGEGGNSMLRGGQWRPDCWAAACCVRTGRPRCRQDRGHFHVNRPGEAERKG